MRLLIAGLAGLGLALSVTGLPPLRRLGLVDRVEPYLNGLGGNPSVPDAPHRRASSLRDLVDAKLSAFLPGGGPLLRSRLVSSGSGLTVQAFRVEQVLWAGAGLCLSTGWMVLLGWLSGNLAVEVAPVLPVVGAMTGAAARDWRLSRQIAERRDRIRQEMPVAIDLLTLAVMAGEAVPAAFARVGAMLEGDVAREFRHAFGSIRAGASTASAIQELAARLPHPSAARLADCLCIAIERGAPLADALRAQADDLREARRRDLLEMGGRREIAMLVPVIFLILPTIVVFVLLPGLVSLDLVVL